ncbi:MAG: ABC transporter substrate-binding protein, partial [Xanthobacteraceae bacterium]
MNRRSLLGSTLLAVTALPLRWPRSIGAALADDKNWRHGVSSFGDLKHPAGFTQFEYVNADAPKGGTARDAASGTFDNFNRVVAGVKGSLAVGIDLIYETLLVSSLDEVATGYGLLAEAVRFPADFSSATYRLRQQATWHDGTPVTSDDVIFSFEAFKKYSPELSAYYRHVIKAEKTGNREVTFTADASGNRELPRIIGELTVLPKRWWEGTDPNGKKRNIGETTLEPPLGSGPYRIKDFSAGHYIFYERVKDHWSSGLNVNVGLYNFDELRYEYFRDTTAALEGFKADIVDWRTENSAKDWATAYDFPAVS